MENLQGIKITGYRDAGTFYIDYFILVEGMELKGIESVVSKLENGHEISFSDPISGDCIREIRYSKKGYEMKLCCHGSSGTWKQSSKTEVIEWVNEVAKYNLRGKGIYSPASYSIEIS